MRPLSDLVGDEIVTHKLSSSWRELDIRGITANSKEVKPGFIFAAIAGAKVDGRNFIGDAVAHGAVAILTDSVPADVETKGVPVLKSKNPRHSLAMMAARFYGEQPRWIVAVTGTDGKTSTAHFFQQLWKIMGEKSASIGTLGVICPPGLPSYPAINTTPDPVLLHKTLADLAGHSVNHVAMEASSHGLDQHRLDGVNVRVAGFTNLTRDHLDYHHTEEAYFQAKRRLFAEVMTGGGVAVINADDPHYTELKRASISTGHKVMGYGKAGDWLKLISAEPHALGQRVVAEIKGERIQVDIPLIGGFQVLNILCAVGMSMACGADLKQLKEAMTQLTGVPGRLERVAEHQNGAPVFVDYAHTPGGLESMLKYVRPHVEKRLLLVFGCGGDRDKGKRPLMGKIAAKHANKVYVTDDNPRTEVPAEIRKEILVACPGAKEVEGRMEAIITAVKELQAGDALVIAGKGHEKMQIIGNVTHPFDDAEVARKAVQAVREKAI